MQEIKRENEAIGHKIEQTGQLFLMIGALNYSKTHVPACGSLKTF